MPHAPPTAEHRTERRAEQGDQHRLPPDRPAQLAAVHADGPQQPELTGPLVHRQRQGVGDADEGDDHGQGQQAVDQVQHLSIWPVIAALKPAWSCSSAFGQAVERRRRARPGTGGVDAAGRPSRTPAGRTGRSRWPRRCRGRRSSWPRRRRRRRRRWRATVSGSTCAVGEAERDRVADGQMPRLGLVRRSTATAPSPWTSAIDTAGDVEVVRASRWPRCRGAITVGASPPSTSAGRRPQRRQRLRRRGRPRSVVLDGRSRSPGVHEPESTT